MPSVWSSRPVARSTPVISAPTAPETGWMPMSLTGLILSSVMRRVWIYAALAPFLVVALFPVFWMVITAFKDDRDLYSMRGIPFWFYEPPTLKHFHLLFTQTWFGAWFVNTALVSVCVVAITLATAVPAGYALARARQEFLYAVVMAAPVDQKVVTVGLPTMLIRGDIYFWGALMAGGLLVGVPAAVLFSAVVDRFIQGLTMASD